MKTAVLHEFGKPLTIEEKTIPEPGPGETLIKVKANRLCASDLHIQNRLIGAVRLPYTPGYGMAGEIAAVGPGAARVRIEDHTMAAIDLVCGSYRHCLSGRASLCRSLERIDSERDSSHQEYCIIPEGNTFLVADWIPFNQVARLPDAVGRMYSAVKSRAQVGPGSRLLVLGTEGLGMNAIQSTRTFGVEVYVTSHQKAKLDMVLEMEADGVIDTSCQNLGREIGRLTGGEICDAAIDSIDIKDSISQVLKVMASGGRVTVCDYQCPCFIAGYQDVMKLEKEIVGLRGMTRQNLRKVVRLAESRKIAPFMYQTVPFEAINEGLRMLRTRAARGRVILKMEK